MDLELDPNNEVILWVGACDYYLGRMTYAVSDFCGLLIEHWNDLYPDTRTVIKRRVEDAYERKERGVSYALGMECDEESWNKVRRLWE